MTYNSLFKALPHIFLASLVLRISLFHQLPHRPRPDLWKPFPQRTLAIEIERALLKHPPDRGKHRLQHLLGEERVHLAMSGKFGDVTGREGIQGVMHDRKLVARNLLRNPEEFIPRELVPDNERFLFPRRQRLKRNDVLCHVKRMRERDGDVARSWDGGEMVRNVEDDG